MTSYKNIFFKKKSMADQQKSTESSESEPTYAKSAASCLFRATDTGEPKAKVAKQVSEEEALADLKIHKLVNLTPHAIKVYRADNDETPVLVIGSQGNARLRSVQFNIGIVDGVPIVTPQIFENVEGLPDVKKGEQAPPILVSALVGEWIAKEQSVYPGHVYSPDTSPNGVVRDSLGAIIGCRRIVLYK